MGLLRTSSRTSQEGPPFSEGVPGKARALTDIASKHTSLGRSAIAFGQVEDAIACHGPTMEATQGEISGQSRTDSDLARQGCIVLCARIRYKGTARGQGEGGDTWPASTTPYSAAHLVHCPAPRDREGHHFHSGVLLIVFACGAGTVKTGRTLAKGTPHPLPFSTRAGGQFSPNFHSGVLLIFFACGATTVKTTAYSAQFPHASPTHDCESL